MRVHRATGARASAQPGRLTVLAGVGLVAALGCEAAVPVYCPSVLDDVRLRPTDTTLHVGQSFVPNAKVTYCRGRAISQTVWLSAAGVVLHVDSATGLVTAMQPGEAVVKVNVEHIGVVAELPVTVTPAP